MSHFTTLKTQIKDPETLEQTFGNMELEFESDPEGNLSLTDYYGNTEPVTAHYALRASDIRAVFPTYSVKADFGFIWNPETGSYDIHADHMDCVMAFRNKLMQQYPKTLAINNLRAKGFEVQDEIPLEDGRLQLVMSR